MKIGILSDTHKKSKLSQKVINHLIKNGAEFLIHAGDIGEPEILEQLKKSGLKYIAVYGNNDAPLVAHHNRYNLVQEPYYFKLSGVKFKLMHLPFYMSPDADIVIFGHTHIFECDFKNNTLFLNPGEACARNKPLAEWAMLDITEKGYNVTYYNKNTKNGDLNESHFFFERTL
ncbi:metallophosphoesterase family protein [Sulfurimonas sp. HSL-1716]|uniref:metallophosphoesterase family protein n=1 Tax=Hydrocurvibacter sulfurireducens TaxID=3131937 RepID=UPI0031F9E2C8